MKTILALAATLLLPATGCVTGLGQRALAEMRGYGVYAPPTRAWIVHDTLLVESRIEPDAAPPRVHGHFPPTAAPFERVDHSLGAAVLHYRLPERPDWSAELPILRFEPLSDVDPFVPPPCAVEVPVKDLGYRLQLEEGPGVGHLWIVAQGLTLPLTIAADAATVPPVLLAICILGVAEGIGRLIK